MRISKLAEKVVLAIKDEYSIVVNLSSNIDIDLPKTIDGVKVSFRVVGKIGVL
jgi:hypothetical protein